MTATPHDSTTMLALAGGVGGAKLALGLSKVLPPSRLIVVVNTGDDEEFYGLHVSPDLDTVMYTLAGVYNRETGWGLEGDTRVTLGALSALGEDTWFGLGDRDLATHLRRTAMLRRGYTLSEVTASLCRALGVTHVVAPMCDGAVRTKVLTKMGELAFQEYFVKHRCEPAVEGLRFDGDGETEPSPAFREALRTAGALVFCPSNPFLSVAPVLAVSGVRPAIERFTGTRIAVSPIVGGKALRGPAAKMLAELGHDVSALGVARSYRKLCDVFVVDEADRDLAPEIEALGMDVVVTDTVMYDDADKIRLAEQVCRIAGLTV